MLAGSESGCLPQRLSLRQPRGVLVLQPVELARVDADEILGRTACVLRLHRSACPERSRSWFDFIVLRSPCTGGQRTQDERMSRLSETMRPSLKTSWSLRTLSMFSRGFA